MKVIKSGKSPEGWDVRIVDDPQPDEYRYRVEVRTRWSEGWQCETESNELLKCEITYDDLMS